MEKHFPAGLLVFLAVVCGCLVTPFIYLLAGLYSGGGHSLTAVIVGFPYGLILGIILKDSSVAWLEPVILFVQFPFYGLILGVAQVKGKQIRVIIILLVLHVLFSALGLILEARVRGRSAGHTPLITTRIPRGNQGHIDLNQFDSEAGRRLFMFRKLPVRLLDA